MWKIAKRLEANQWWVYPKVSSYNTNKLNSSSKLMCRTCMWGLLTIPELGSFKPSSVSPRGFLIYTQTVFWIGVKVVRAESVQKYQGSCQKPLESQKGVVIREYFEYWIRPQLSEKPMMIKIHSDKSRVSRYLQIATIIKRSFHNLGYL